jgi:peptide/nickel transport system substrate-binding protein
VQLTSRSKTTFAPRWSMLIVILLFGSLLAACGTQPVAPAVGDPAAPADPAPAEQATIPTDREAPSLAARVQAGELPPLEERLPSNPLVVDVVDSLGQYGGTWRSGLRGGQDNAWLLRIMGYDYLVRWTPDWDDVIPNLAESFEANEDATEFTFNLREGTRWSDGEPFTADDILFWYEDVLIDEEYSLTHPVANWLTAGGEPVTVEKVDDYTVKFIFAEPNGLFIQRLATPSGADPTRYAKHYCSQFHPRYNEDNLDELISQNDATDWVNLFELKCGGVPGTPYDALWYNAELPTLYAWDLTIPYGGTTTQVIAERNPYYWKVDPEGRQLPYIDRLAAEIGEEVQVLVLRALNGEIDMQDRHIATLDNKAVFADNMDAGGYGFYDTIPSSMNSVAIALNLTHKDPMKREIYQNKDFRIALSHAINRQEIIDVVFVGQGEPYQLAPRPTSPFYNERLAKQYTEHDPALANEILDGLFPDKNASGYRLGPDGNPIVVDIQVTAVNTSQVDAMELVRGYWEEVGIQTNVSTMDRSLFYTRKDGNEHDVAIWGGDGGLDVILEPRWYFPFSGESLFAQAWVTWYNNPSGQGALTAPEEPPAAVQQQMDLYDQIKATGDAEEQAELMNQLLEIAADQFYAIGIGLPSPGYGIVQNNFHNVPSPHPGAWLYPNPGPTNPQQYWIEQ